MEYIKNKIKFIFHKSKWKSHPLWLCPFNLIVFLYVNFRACKEYAASEKFLGHNTSNEKPAPVFSGSNPQGSLPASGLVIFSFCYCAAVRRPHTPGQEPARASTKLAWLIAASPLRPPVLAHAWVPPQLFCCFLRELSGFFSLRVPILSLYIEGGLRQSRQTLLTSTEMVAASL